MAHSAFIELTVSSLMTVLVSGAFFSSDSFSASSFSAPSASFSDSGFSTGTVFSTSIRIGQAMKSEYRLTN